MLFKFFITAVWLMTLDVTGAFQTPLQRNEATTLLKAEGRRDFLASAGTTLLPLVAGPLAANAGIDPNALRNFQIEGDASGAATRLKEIEAIQKPAEDLVNKEYEKLSSGVSYREYREGKGEAMVENGSKVAVEMTIRCQSFATANEPGGVKYFSTKEDTEFNELAWTIGSGALPPGLEEGMVGMHRNGLRRIELPSQQVFAARNANQLPSPTTKAGQRVYDRLFKTDATLLFEVLVTRIK